MRRRVWLTIFLAVAMAGSVFAAPRTQTRLLLSADSARAGDTIWAGLEMDMPAGWHTYWRNGGDAGEATRIQWILPTGVSSGEINWPIPAKLTEPAGDTPLVTYIYTNKVILLTPITLAKDLAPGMVELKAVARWMECADICIYSSNNIPLQATLTISDTAKPSADARLLDEWRAKVPPRGDASLARASWEGPGSPTNSRPLLIEWLTNVVAADFYPYLNTNFDVSGVTTALTTGSNSIRLEKIVHTNGNEWPSRVMGILVGKAGSDAAVGVEVDLPIAGSSVNETAATAPGTSQRAATAPGSLATMLLLAFVGGLILNFMPCVLPIIALKILGFVKQSTETPGRARTLGIVYGLGVMASFLVLAGLAIGVQRAGGAANWGDAFRNPHFQVALTVLMTLIALNLFGVFEITLSSRAAGAAVGLASRQGAPGAFFNGVLATILATPCTAPFLGVALAFAFTQSAPVILGVFAAAGVGFAFPFVLLCARPNLLKVLPKPGVWMEKFKIAVGFPMLATAVWLLWVSANASDEVLWLGEFLVILALAAWVWGEFVQRGISRKGLAAVISVFLIAGDIGLLVETKPSPDAIVWSAWSPQAVEEAQKSGHPVLVDFTARTCLTCQVNKRTSIEIPSTRAKIKQTGTVALIGDFTREDPLIAKELQKYSGGGVPLVLVYSKDPTKPPEVLPTTLLPSIVQDALTKAAE